MTDDREQRIEALFAHATALDPAHRDVFVDGLDGDDAELREELISLLRYDDTTTSFLDRPIVPPLVDVDWDDETLPESFDGFVFLSRLGVGGFGEVYLAEQTHPVRRRVAVKLIRPGMNSRQLLARFEAERQALAMMDHPGIAKILGAGSTPEGRPYFAMEYVRGAPITCYCDQHSFDLRSRVELFAEVCRGVHHAHQKGVIHRDLKPSNVLVAEHEGRATPMIIDFGIAKAIDEPLTDRTIVTEQRSFLGTPDYVSPEQAESGGQDLDTRSDIYSLGVMLYEILTGVTPFDLRSSTLEDARRVIQQVDPPRPSTRLALLGETLNEVARHRGTDSRALTRSFDRDLDWIVLKCLEKDRGRRYDSASALTEDLQRYLDNQPVLAGPPTWRYRVRKFVRRHRVPVATATLLIVATLLGLTASTLGFVEARRERDNAEREGRRAAAVQEFFVERMIDAANPGLGGDAQTPVGEIIDRAAAEVGDAFPNDPDIEATIRAALGRAFSQLGRYQDALAQLERAIELGHAAGLGLSPLLSWRGDRAEALRMFGDRDGALTEVREAEAVAARELGPLDRVSVRLESILGTNLWRSARYEESEEVHRRNIEKVEQVYGPDHVEVALAKSRLGLALRAQDKTPAAIELYEQAVAILERRLSPEHPRTLTVKNNLAVALEEIGRTEEAEQLHRSVYETRRRVLGDAHAHTVDSLRNVARSLSRKRDYAGAEALHRDALRGYEASQQSPDHPSVLQARRDLVNSIKNQGRLDEAAELYEALIRDDRRVLGETPEVAYVLTSLADLETRRNNHARAAELRREAVAIHLEHSGAAHRETYRAEDWLVSSLHALDERNELRQFREAQIARMRHACLETDPPPTDRRTWRRWALLQIDCEFDDLRDVTAGLDAAHRVIDLGGDDDAAIYEVIGILERLAGHEEPSISAMIRGARLCGATLDRDAILEIFRGTDSPQTWRERLREAIRRARAPSDG
ncbi:MAG: tetratricopeptide repeat protein [Planctomycetes bacterium]|nr:tetratricopeptide repeat protein [Planctomycetota bacterium]